MRTLHALIEEFVDDQANDDDLRPRPLWLTVTSAPTPAHDWAVMALSAALPELVDRYPAEAEAEAERRVKGGSA